MFKWPYDAPHRGRAHPGEALRLFRPRLRRLEVPGEPYTNAPGTDWQWWRTRMLGGRTNHWGRISLRMGPYDFKPYSRDGKGFDWPITYDDLAPYYDKTEELIGVFGSAEGLENTPDGKFQPPPAPRCYERLIQKACDKLGIPCIPSRLAILTRPLNGRPACHYCAQCGRACANGSNFSSPRRAHPAGACHRATWRSAATPWRAKWWWVPTAWPRGVSYIDKKTRKRSAGARQNRGAGGELLRDRAHPAQFQEQPVSQRPGQLHAAWWAAT